MSKKSYTLEPAPLAHVPTSNSLNNFSSVTHLTEKDQYDPAAERDQEKGQSTSGALAHLLKSCLGTGILAMPMAFNNAGLALGMIGTLVVGFLCTHCVHILVKTSQNLCREIRVPSLDFSETAEKVFLMGPKPFRKWSNFAKQFVDASLIATYYAAACVYIVFIGTSFHSVINDRLGVDWDIRLYIAMTVVPCLLMGQIRNLKWLMPFSAMANIFIVVTFGITLFFMFRDPLVYADKPLVADISRVPIFFSTVVFAMEGIGAVMPIENGMKKPQQFLGCPGVLNTSMFVTIILYAMIGFFGYVRYGDDVKGSITLNLPQGHPLADTAKLLMAVAILFTFGLQFYVPNDILWRKISHKFRPERHNITQILLRSGIVLVSGGIAAAIPNLDPFIGLVGSVFFSLLGIFVPSFLETVYLWPSGLGFAKWKLIKNFLLCVMAILALITGSMHSIADILREAK